MRRSTPWAGFSLGQLWAALAIGASVLLALSGDVVTVDSAYVIRAGSNMLSSQALLDRDTFTFTIAGEPWINQQWGAQIIFSLLHRAGGWELLAIARAILVGGAFYGIYVTCRWVGAARRVAAGLTLAALAVALPQLGVRSQLFAIVLFVVSSLVLALRHERPRMVWTLIPIMVLWVNLHGTFFLLPILVLLALAEDRTAEVDRRRLLTVGAAALAASIVNPFGLRVWSYVVSVAGDSDVRSAVTEWAPPDPTTYAGGVFFTSVAAALLFLATRSRRPNWALLGGMLFFLVLGSMSERGTIWWALAMPPMLVRHAGLVPQEEREPRSLTNAFIMAMICLMVLPLAPWWRGSVTGRPLLAEAPHRLTKELSAATEPGDRIFNAQIWGSWLELEVPNNPIFIDSRIELFPSHVWSDYRSVSQARDGWQDILIRWGVDAAILNTEQQEQLIAPMKEDPGWLLIAADETGAVFTRVTP